MDYTDYTARPHLNALFSALSAQITRIVWPRSSADRASPLRAAAAVIIGVTLASVCIGFVELRIHVPNSSLIYLFVVLWLAIAYGRAPAMVAAVLAILADDYFFVPPLHRLWVNALPEWSALFMLLVVSVVTSHLTSLVREREREAVANQHAAEAARAELATRNDQLHEQVRMHQELARMRQEVSDREHITRAVIAASEEERRRISRELHDVTGQDLTALLLGLQALQAALPTSEAATMRIERVQEIAQAVQREVHDLALQLRPTALDDLGLVTALEAHVEQWAGITGIEVDVHCAGLSNGRLPSQIEVTLYRVIQEALNNIAKHAQARRVSLIVERRADHVLAIIEDDGCGFDAQVVEGPTTGMAVKNRLGMLGMQERVGQVEGTLTIETSPEEGTAIFVRIPLEQARMCDPSDHLGDTSGNTSGDTSLLFDVPIAHLVEQPDA